LLLLAARIVWAIVFLCLVYAAWVFMAPSRPAPVRPEVLAPIDVGPGISAFYRERAFRPLWVSGSALRPEAGQLRRMIGPSPSLDAAIQAARDGDPGRLTRADLLLSQAFAAYVRTHLRPPAANRMRYIDPGLAPAPTSDHEALDAAARSPSLARHLGAVESINPVYDGLRRGLTTFRGTPQQRRLILANMERARAIPARPGGRYILVDTASARLWMIEDGRIVGAMRVVVGKRAMPTPLMAGMIRYAVLNPYWNLPPDLIRERARKGARAIAAEHLQVLSDWSPRARLLDPRRVDWRAVAAGRRFVNLRQTPGAHNMMGRIKFMMPNDLGVYLHDTPLRDLLARSDRHFSSGCVRLEDAQRLARWLFNGPVPRATGAAEQRVDLPEPVPVYLAYFTALPSRGGIVFHTDVYDRDGARAPARNRAGPARRAAPAASRRHRGRAAAARPALRPSTRG
jgi:murein L,D-transpeptidase YcbB/YkuD